MAASTKGQEESAQKPKEVASVPSESKRKLPVGAYVSSVHVDYESFEVGTGQVRSCMTRAAYFVLESHIFIVITFLQILQIFTQHLWEG